ncbi:MAG: hypothetical protein ACRBEE_08310 [Arenicella sp.]
MERLMWPVLLIIALLIIGLTVLNQSGTSNPQAYGKSEKAHIHDDSHEHEASPPPALHFSKAHVHHELDISSWVKKPSVELVVERDDMAGWNVHVKAKNFRFSPERVNEILTEGEGHAHLFVDGNKVARLYGEWFHLGDLTAGKHEIKVSLNANNHAALVLNGQIISAVYDVEQ